MRVEKANDAVARIVAEEIGKKMQSQISLTFDIPLGNLNKKFAQEPKIFFNHGFKESAQKKTYSYGPTLQAEILKKYFEDAGYDVSDLKVDFKNDVLNVKLIPSRIKVRPPPPPYDDSATGKKSFWSRVFRNL